MRNKGVADFILSHRRMTALLLIAVGVALRCAATGYAPGGLNQDEASAAYEAWSLLNSGMDRNGCSWPVLFTAWGSGQNVLYSYLAMPFIAVFGLSAWSFRLVSGICGSVSLVLIYLMARRSEKEGLALAVLAAAVICPWHIMLSRWGLESNLLPFTLLAGAYFLVLSQRRPAAMLGAGAAFGASLYAYGTAYIFLPVFLTASTVYMAVRRELRLRWFLPALGIFVLLALPISLCNLRNALGLPETKLLWMTLPKLTETRQTATTVLASANALGGVLTNLNTLLRLLWKQNDGLVWNSIGPWGLFWSVPGLALAVLGLVMWAVRGAKKQNAGIQDGIMAIWLACAFLASLLVDVNVNRVNFIFIPMVWFQARGAYELLEAAGRRAVLPAAVSAAALCAAFCFTYLTTWRQQAAPAFCDGLCQAIGFAETQKGEIWVTGDVNMPYIYALFCERTPTGEFLDSVVYVNPDGAFRNVSSFGRFRFYGEPPENAVKVMEKADAEGVVLAEFGGFVVCR